MSNIQDGDSSGLTAVGIGASAGGLEALKELVAELRPGGNMTYFIAQHLSPTYKSMMVDLLSKNAQIPITEARQGETIEVDTIYVCPPNQMITVENGKIQLEAPKSTYIGPKPNIDLLFESIAHEYKSKSVGVILSGTGSDGARGLRMIKSFAGFTYVQDPDTAKYDGMPKSAIMASKVDFILDPQEIGSEINNLASRIKDGTLVILDTKNEQYLQIILQRLHENSKINFTLYKTSTIMRRIDRRMIALKVSTLSDYSKYLSQHSEELDLLYKNILIGVTSFFRDFTAFELIQHHLGKLIKEKTEKSIRLWVPGCSTGEEAYTLAIMLNELLGPEVKHWKIQIFATDIDDDALDFARKGEYVGSALSPLSDAQIKKFFTINEDRFVANSLLRSLIVFSKHDLIMSPPFKSLDLITCRNLLIYLNQQAQSKIFPMFHYALRKGGMLMLGKSENIGHFHHLFSVKDSRWKIFQVLKSKEASLLEPVRGFNTDLITGTSRRTAINTRGEHLINKEAFLLQIQQHWLPMSLLINDAGDIIYTGGNIPYLKRPVGESTNYIYPNLLDSLSTECRVLVQEAKSKNKSVKSSYKKIEILPGVTRYVRMIAAPMEIDDGLKSVMLCFQEEDLEDPHFIKANISQSVTANETIERLEEELKQTESRMQVLVEELESSNEELQSLNEELQSANEELQSTNEELETTNEELQSTNEELTSAYAELNQAYDDKEIQSQEISNVNERLTQVNAEYRLAQSIANIGHYHWDINTDEITWSHQTYEIYGFKKIVNHPTLELILHRVHPEDRKTVEEHIEKSLNTGKFDLSYRLFMDDASIKYVRGNGTVTYNDDKTPAAMLGTIQDISAEMIAKIESQKRQQKVDTLLNSSLNGIYLYNVKTGTNIYTNKSYERITGYNSDDMNNLTAEEFASLFGDDIDKVSAHMEEVIASEENHVVPLVYQFKHKDGHMLKLHSSDIVFERDEAGNCVIFLGSFVELADNI